MHRIELFQKKSVSSVIELAQGVLEAGGGSQLSLRVREGRGTVSGRGWRVASGFSNEWGESRLREGRLGGHSQQREQTAAKSLHSHVSNCKQLYVPGRQKVSKVRVRLRR